MGLLKRLTGSLYRVEANPIVHLAVLISIVVASLALPATAASPESEREVRQLLARLEKAIRAKDVDAVMAVYAAGAATVLFNSVPPLATTGWESYRKNYQLFFDMYQGSLDVEFRDLRIVASKDVAFIHCLQRTSGTLKGGLKDEMWVRITSGLRKINGKWLIVHDHVSVPVDFVTGKAVFDLKPGGEPQAR